MTASTSDTLVHAARAGEADGEGLVDPFLAQAK
jgi:hypothetical protein